MSFSLCPEYKEARLTSEMIKSIYTDMCIFSRPKHDAYLYVEQHATLVPYTPHLPTRDTTLPAVASRSDLNTCLLHRQKRGDGPFRALMDRRTLSRKVLQLLTRQDVVVLTRLARES
jgi:hypothetical protein